MKEIDKKVEKKIFEEIDNAAAMYKVKMAELEREMKFKRMLMLVKSLSMVVIIFMAGWTAVNVDPVTGLVVIGFGLLIKDI